MDSAQDTLAGGLPHSEIPGSPIARISPGLFAACHVLHRLSVPRHPPNALKRLIRSSSAAHREQSPPHNDSKASTLTLSTHSITRLAVNPRSLRPRAFAQGQATRANSQSHSYPQCQRAGIRDQASQPALFMFLGMARDRPQSAGGADRDRTGDPLLAKQVLSQLSYGPKSLMNQTRWRTRDNRWARLVGQGRFELPTSRLSSARSNQLSY